MQGKRWCFTLNNYSDAQLAAIIALGESDEIAYLVVGKETGESGTPHLQGFVIFTSNKRLRSAKRLLSDQAHLELARGNNVQAAEYCKKDGDYNEFGELPIVGRNKEGQWERFRSWCKAQDHRPTTLELIEQFPGLYARYEVACWKFVDRLCPVAPLVNGEMRPWQRELSEQLGVGAGDRKVTFVVDPTGGMGKSWFIRFWYGKYPLLTQRLSIGKRDDLAYAIDAEKRYFLFDVPRGNGEYLQYGILEQLKDRMVFSPKYESVNKVFAENVHVVVFMNEAPDMNKMTGDRYHIIRLSNLPVHNIMN